MNNTIKNDDNKPESKSFARYTITSALPYANGPIHIGHLAGVYVPADIYARYLRLKGRDVVFIGGSDEHGVPITIKARQEGVHPQDVVDKYHGMIRDSFSEFGISFDVYSRTSSALHHETASAFFRKLYEKGIFAEKENEQYFDEESGQFLADRYITGTCPHCGNEKAYGDQCENCGSSLSPTELKNPRSVLSGNSPVMRKTRHWYLPLDAYEPMLREWILEGHHDDWKSNVYGQCKSWIDQGLQARAVTRDLDWGVRVPVEGAEGKVLYVWFDAPIGYISATREWGEARGVDWEKYWKSGDSKLVHFIGKDNIVFHCIIFPVMLHAEGSYILPENVPANEFLNLENDKISTSRNWAVWLHEYLHDFPGKQDVLRYVLCAAAPETKDNDFTWKDFQTRNNSELLAIFGNFVNRTLVLTHKYFEGKVPAAGALSPSDMQALEALKAFPDKISASLEGYRFREALSELMNVARLGNRYLTEAEPWKIVKQDPERVKTILNVSLQICASLAVLSEPFLPFTSARMFDMLNLPGAGTSARQSVSEKSGATASLWNQAGTAGLLPVGHSIKEPYLLFEKIEDETIEKQVQKLLKTKESNQQPASAVSPLKQTVSYEDFSRLDIRMATIKSAEKLPKAKKLLKIELETGLGIRTVVSGIAGIYEPADIIGKQVVYLANLETRELRGVKSEGMILMAEDEKGNPCFLQAEKTQNDGTVIR